MRRENFFKEKGHEGFSYALFHLLMIVFLLIMLIVSVVLTSGCSRMVIPEKPTGETGMLMLSFAKDEGVYNPDTKQGVLQALSFIREVPDTNMFILTVKSSAGDVIFSGRYSERPEELELSPGSYDIKVVSSIFNAPGFDIPCFSDSATVVVESGEVTRLSFICRMSNGAVKLGFSAAFKERFSRYMTVIEDCNGKADYPFNENRYLYLAPGDVFLRMVCSSDSFLLTRKILNPTEMVTINLHSSVPGDEDPGDDANLYTGIIVDTASVWLSEELVVGERRDGSSRELALGVDEIAGFAGEKDVWVCGYIAGYLTTASLIAEPPFGTETNIALASVPGEKDRIYCAGVALPAGDIRSELNLKDNPGNLGKKLWVKGTITASYFGLAGVNPITEFYME